MKKIFFGKGVPQNDFSEREVCSEYTYKNPFLEKKSCEKYTYMKGPVTLFY